MQVRVARFTEARCGALSRRLSSAAAMTAPTFEFDRSNMAVTAEMHPGARVFTINQKNGRNSVSVLETIKKKLALIQPNHTVGVVVFNIQELDLLTTAEPYGGTTDSPEFLHALRLVNSMPDTLMKCRKHAVTVFNGRISNAAYSAFHTPLYRVGTRNTSFQLTGLQQGFLPVGARLAHRLIRGCPRGVGLTRFLGITEKPIDVFEMWGMGMLTHITEADPHITLMHTLSHTTSPMLYVKGAQTSVIDARAVSHILRTMHLEGDELIAAADHPLHGEFMPVLPSEISAAMPEEPEEEGKLPSLFKLEKFTQEFFETKSAEASRTKLQKASKQSAHPHAHLITLCLDKMSTIDDAVLANWFTITSRANQEGFQELEMKLIKSQGAK